MSCSMEMDSDNIGERITNTTLNFTQKCWADFKWLLAISIGHLISVGTIFLQFFGVNKKVRFSHIK